MHFKSVVPILLVGSAAAAPTTRQAAIDPALQRIEFTVMALRSASPVHFLSLNAIAGRFYLGGNTTSYCPPDVHDCPAGNTTIFKNSCSLSAEAPEYEATGQTVWNTDNGVMGYDFSQPRPDDALNCPFYLGASQNAAFTAELTTTYDADGFLACPTASTGIWQVLRNVGAALEPPQGDTNACLGISLVALNYTLSEYGTWQYS